ncbi:MAG: hypothetical protein V3W43_08505 [Desulfatiglandaceae bacterium]
MTVVVVSHDIDLAAQYCHQLVILKDGHLFSIGTPGSHYNVEYRGCL